MKQGRKRSRLWGLLSVLYLAAASLLLFSVCGRHDPEFGSKIRTAILGRTDSPVREAFGVLADGLEAGEPVKEAVSASVEVLFGEVD